jgi:nucleotide-binding universal stress UspA family protein
MSNDDSEDRPPTGVTPSLPTPTRQSLARGCDTLLRYAQEDRGAEGAVKRILIATDFSPDAGQALKHGVAFAQMFDAEIELFTSYAVPTLALGPEAFALPAGFLEQSEAATRKQLEQIAASLREQGIAVDCSVGPEYPSGAICDRARASGADLIAMGTAGRRGLDHVLLGSVAERVVRLGPCPVLTVSSRAPEVAPIRKVLVATDFSRDAEAALAWADTLIARCGASLILVHSVPPPFGLGEEESYQDDERTRTRMEESRAQLEELAKGIDAEVEVAVGRRYPETDALAQAAERGADLIVVGTRGRRGLPHVVFGSTAERVIRRAPLPVVSVKHSN